MINKFRVLFVVLLVSTILFSFTSCKKTEITVNTSAATNPSLLKTETTSVSSVDKESDNKVTTVNTTPDKQMITEAQTVAENNQEANANVNTPVVTANDVISNSVSDEVVDTSKTVLENFIKESTTELFKVDELVFNDDGSITAYYRYGMLVQAIITVGDENLSVEFKSISLSGDDIDYFISQYASLYPSLASYVTYENSAESIVFHYPTELMGGKYYKLLTLAFLNDAVTKALDELQSSVGTLEVKSENGEKVYMHSFEVFGTKTMISATNRFAVIESERAFTDEEIYMAANVLVANNSDLMAVNYQIDGNKIVLSYPEISEDYLKQLLDSIDNIILSYTPMLLPELSEEGIALEIVPVEPVYEEPVVDVVSVEVKPEVETLPPVVIVPANETVVAVTKQGKKIQHSVYLGGELGLNTEMHTYFGVSAAYEMKINKHFAVGAKSGVSATLDIPFETYMKLYLKNVYAKAGVGFNYNVYDNKFSILGEAGIGFELPLEDAFSVFAEVGARTYYNKVDFNTFGYMTVGGKVNF